jgi:hypothetical protein
MTSRGFEIPGDVPLIVRVFLLVLCYIFLVRFVSIQRILDSLSERRSCRNGNEGDRALQELLLDKAWRASNFFLGRLLKQRDFCLPRTLALCRWCKSAAVDAGMVIGVRKEGGVLKGHAWLLVEGVPYRESGEDLEQYAPMLRI